MADYNLLIEDLTLDEAELLDEILSDLGESRRQFLGQMTAASLGTLVVHFLAKRNALAGTFAELAPPAVAEENAVTVAMRINGVSKTVTLDSRASLLDALRERLGLTGTKKG